MSGASHLLRVGWPSRSGEEPDHDAYAFLLRGYSAEQVEAAIGALVGTQKFTPKAAQIAKQVMAMSPAPASKPDAELDPATAAKRAWMDELDRRETERRDRVLDEWAPAHPEQLADWERAHPPPIVGAGILKRLPVAA